MLGLIGLRKLHLSRLQLPLEHGELVAEGEDLRTFGLIFIEPTAQRLRASSTKSTTR